MNIGGDSIRVVHPLFQEEGSGSSPTSPLQFIIEPVNIHIAIELNKLWHSRLPIYKTGFCLIDYLNYAAVFKNRYYAVAIWTPPVARLLSHNTCLELRRMAIAPDAPKYTASHMLAIMARLIYKKMPNISRLISYQDKEIHNGTIYKAAGWKIASKHVGGLGIDRKVKISVVLHEPDQI